MQRKTIFSKDFLLVAIGQIISLFGNQILRYALPLYLLHQTGSSALFGTISACAFLPMLLLFPIGGMIADRVNKRNIMVILDFSTALLVALFFFLQGKINIVPLMAVTMMILYGIQGAYQPAVNASIPILVETRYIVQANSVVNVISSFASMTGPVVGGVLYSLVGLKSILSVSMICFFISAVMEIFIHIPCEKKQTKGTMFDTVLSDLQESFAFMFRKQPVIWKLSLSYALTGVFLCSLVFISVPVLVTQHLGFSAAAANRLYGYAQGVIAVGSIAGGVLAGTLAKKLTPKVIPLLITGCALSIFLAGAALQLLHGAMEIYFVLVLGCSLLLLLSSLFQIQMLSYVQILTPNHLIGKVVSCVICICMCANPVGVLFYGFLFEKIGTHFYLPFYAAASIVLAICLAMRHIFGEIEQKINQQILDKSSSV